MDEAEILKYSVPLTEENLASYFSKISGWYSLHSTDKTSPLTKIKKCADEIKLDVTNLIHLNFIISTFVATFVSEDEVKEAFNGLIHRPVNLNLKGQLELGPEVQ